MGPSCPLPGRPQVRAIFGTPPGPPPPAPSDRRSPAPPFSRKRVLRSDSTRSPSPHSPPPVSHPLACVRPRQSEGQGGRAAAPLPGSPSHVVIGGRTSPSLPARVLPALAQGEGPAVPGGAAR